MYTNVYQSTVPNGKKVPVKFTAHTGRYTLSDAATLWIQSQKHKWKPGTYTVYMQHLTKYILPFWENQKIHKITEKTMEAFVLYLTTESGNVHLSENYMAQICETVRRILIYMEKKHLCKLFVPDNPVTKKRAHQTILPSDESLAVLERYLSLHCEEDTCLGILIAFHTGIRIGELSALTWQDINLKEGLIYVRGNILRVKTDSAQQTFGDQHTRVIRQCPKTPSSLRTIPFPEKLTHFLKQYQKSDNAYIISGVKNPWTEPRTIQYRFKKILQICGIEYFNFHMLRHAFATRCVSMGLDVKSLSEILGHSNIQMTLNLYVHSTISQKKRFISQYNDLFTLSSKL